MLDKILHTERIVLRILHSGDIPEIEKMHADPEVMLLSGANGPLNKIANQNWCSKNLDHWQRYGYGMYLMETKEDSEFCGFVGLRNLPHYPAPELCWILPKSKWGQGYALEAALKVKEHAFQKLEYRELLHFIDSRNQKSIKLAEKLGARIHREIKEETSGEPTVGLVYVLEYFKKDF